MVKYDSKLLYSLCTSTDANELEEGYRILGQTLYSAVRKQLNPQQFNNNDANDVTQESLYVIWKKCQTDNGPRSPESFLSWAATIAKNKAIDMVRSLQRRKTSSISEHNDLEQYSIIDSNSPQPQDEALRKGVISSILEAISHAFLSENEKTILIQGYLLGKTDKELSSILDASDANIKVIRHRALKKLRNDDDLMTVLRGLL